MAKTTFFRIVLRGAYGLAWAAARPFLRRHKRLQEGFSWRLVPEDWSGPATRTGQGDTEQLRYAEADIWLQAASGGEAYLVWELIERLAARLEAEGRPGPLRVLATTWTRQGLEILQGMALKTQGAHPWLTVRATFFPLDAPGVMGRALDQARPRVVGLLETELWPGLLMACEKRHIPVVVLNGRMTDKSLRNYLRLDAVEPDIWKDMAPARVCAVSRADAARFARLFGEDRVETAPNIKFDRAASAPDAAEAPEALRGLLPGDHAGRTVLLASVREQEEEAALAIIRSLRAADAPAVIVAPRHMHRVKPWLKRLEEAGIPAVPRSRQEGPAPADAVILWDAFGELGQLYRLADAVFVGGSLAPLGGQNFLEALALGKIPCCGPHLDNFAWALEASAPDAADSLEALGLLRRGPDADTVAALLRQELASPEAAEAVRARFRAWLAPRLGGTDQCVRALLEQMK